MSGVDVDLVLRAQVRFLQALVAEWQPRDPRAKALMDERRQPITEEARNRCRNDGLAMFGDRKWSITLAGRAWLAAIPARAGREGGV